MELKPLCTTDITGAHRFNKSRKQVMVLTKCKECGTEISKKAKQCPGCGAPAKKKTSLVTWLVLVMVAVGAYGVSQAPTGKPSDNKSSNAENVASITKTKKSEPIKQGWVSTSSVDKMTGNKSFYAVSKSVQASKRMGFPYSDVGSWLGVGCSKKSEWAYIGFSAAPNLTDAKTEDGRNVIKTRIKWGEKIEPVTLTQKWGASSLHFRSDASVISSIVSSKVVLLELKWHGEQGVYFEYSLNGSSAALKEIRSECANL